MVDKKVTLIRKQNKPYTVNYPVDGRNKNMFGMEQKVQD